MIDVFEDDLLGMHEAAGLMPGRKGAKGIHPATVYRWATVGVHGVKLETIMVGGTRYTSKGALQAFVEAVGADS